MAVQLGFGLAVLFALLASGPAAAVAVSVNVADATPLVDIGGFDGHGFGEKLWIVASDLNGMDDLAAAGFLLRDGERQTVLTGEPLWREGTKVRFETSAPAGAARQWAGILLTDSSGAVFEIAVPPLRVPDSPPGDVQSLEHEAHDDWGRSVLAGASLLVLAVIRLGRRLN